MNHILIVDDEAEIRESLSEILKEDGYAVTSTASATLRSRMERVGSASATITATIMAVLRSSALRLD